MNLRYAFDYFAPTTLVAVISDQMNVTTGPDQRTIVQAAYDALISNVGHDEANDMLFDSGIDAEDMEVYLLPHTNDVRSSCRPTNGRHGTRWRSSYRPSRRKGRRRQPPPGAQSPSG
jgi:hypothetical protein